ncbi:MAG TPA: UDP-N-acetylmuramoyl-L-alanine--D-glutamate ligase [Rhizomicrobium sp.]|jgi:UDP-N-acetylmuramoylalanine--D-glutamate ligase|nr:UDP-N-acetylmuramoyl-L-alanine--D-glutamate ligase [Rhizomicrobium sp.]
MIPVLSFAGRDVGVYGLARSGLSSIAALKAGGARVHAWDDNVHARAQGERLGAQVAPFASWPWIRIRTVVLSPGIPLTHPSPHDVVIAAREAGAELIGDVELFAREIRPDRSKPRHAPLIAITGTNGKSTTTALVGHILNTCGFQAEVGGNIGRSALDLGAPNGRTVYVLEISSYQIDLAPGLSPDLSLLTNIAPDHLERHGSLSNYAAVKARLLLQAAPDGHVVIGVDDPHSAAIYTRLAAVRGAKAIPVSVGKVLGRGIFAVDGGLYDAWSNGATKVMNLAQATRLPGAHNWQNATLAFAAVRPFVKDTRAIASAIASFPGLAHRMEDVGRVGKTRFINDSKATNADAASRALVCFSDIYWIAGGRAKKGGIDPLVEHAGHIRKAYLIGEAAEEFANVLKGHTAVEICGALEAAVIAAYADASRSGVPAPVILLSPACASFDQFRDFEERGDRFRALVGELAGTAEREAS